MSNRQKAEFIDDICHKQSFWGHHGKYVLKPDSYREAKSVQKL
jgi:hypothetical protein